jgi:hypothetical protein
MIGAPAPVFEGWARMGGGPENRPYTEGSSPDVTGDVRRSLAPAVA